MLVRIETWDTLLCNHDMCFTGSVTQAPVMCIGGHVFSEAKQNLGGGLIK